MVVSIVYLEKLPGRCLAVLVWMCGVSLQTQSGRQAAYRVCDGCVTVLPLPMLIRPLVRVTQAGRLGL